MEKGNNNEMDLLLRSLAKSERQNSSGFGPAGNGSAESDSHLDADELNAFAEGLVPEAARARYVAHLADCQSCRGLVVSLSQASGLTTERPVVEQAGGRNLWKSIAELFSPQVIRYAAPALALTAVIVIGLVAFRRNQTPDFVAQHKESTPVAAPPVQVQEPPSTSSNTATLAAPSGAANVPSATPNFARPTPTFREDLAKAPALDDSTTTTRAALPKDAAPPPPPIGATEAAKNQPGYAPEPASGVSAGRVVLSDVNKKAEATKQVGDLDQVPPARERNQYKAGPAKEGEDKTASGLYTMSPSGPRRSEDQRRSEETTERRPAAKSKRDSDEEDDGVRSVAGRRFRRLGNAWVDTGYDSPRATINLARGSEQFRALIADEPAIQTIANQLSGEVIVVWKGRAYRIR